MGGGGGGSDEDGDIRSELEDGPDTDAEDVPNPKVTCVFKEG